MAFVEEEDNKKEIHLCNLSINEEFSENKIDEKHKSPKSVTIRESCDLGRRIIGWEVKIRVTDIF